MNDTEELMSDIYNTLVQIRYPKITTAVAKNVDSMILNGENRISLLSWLLTEKCPETATELQKLKGVTLEAALFKYYSEIGICSDKNLLLGNCKLEEQLPTLRLLLDFIRCIFIESSDIDRKEKKSIDDIVNVYINEDPSTLTSITEPKLSYSESLQYFDNLRKRLDEYQELSTNFELEKEEQTEERFSENKCEEDEGDKNSRFNAEKSKFIEAFSTIGSWPIHNTKNTKCNSYSMDADIQSIYTNFTSLTQFLQAKEEISNAVIPMEMSKINTSLNEIVEEAVTATEDALTVINDY